MSKTNTQRYSDAVASTISLYMKSDKNGMQVSSVVTTALLPHSPSASRIYHTVNTYEYVCTWITHTPVWCDCGRHNERSPTIVVKSHSPPLPVLFVRDEGVDDDVCFYQMCIDKVYFFTLFVIWLHMINKLVLYEKYFRVVSKDEEIELYNTFRSNIFKLTDN